MGTNPLIGKTVTAVFLSEGGYAIRFDTSEVTSIIARAYGDCCSRTWIENVDGAEQLLGTVVSVDDIPSTADVVEESAYGDVTSYYGCKITTDKGFAVIDYRNESNGYYGGSLSWPGDYFYGGVYNQNNKEFDTWRQIA